MSLNIKDPEVHRLAREISQATGESMTRIVADALRARHAELVRRQRRAGMEELRTLAGRVAVLAQATGPAPDHGALLYDEHGLPT